MSIAAWLTAEFHKRHRFSTTGTRDVLRYILFVSTWTIVVGTSYLVLFLAKAGSVVTSFASQSVLYAYGSLNSSVIDLTLVLPLALD